MASWFVMIKYTAMAVPPTITGHTMTRPNVCTDTQVSKHGAGTQRLHALPAF